MSNKTSINPDGLEKKEIHNIVKFCPVCGTPWKRGAHTCANTACGIKLRVEPKALNWWMFYPKCNSWAHLKD
jgi:hypothetical protein